MNNINIIKIIDKHNKQLNDIIKKQYIMIMN